MPDPTKGGECAFKSALVVEPARTIQQIANNFLRACGVEEVSSCKTPVEALRILATSYCDVVLCSSVHGAGIALAGALRHGSDSPNRAIPIVLLAQGADADTVKLARDQGIDIVLVVPFSVSELQRRLAALGVENRPLTQCAGYVGPDRRRNAQPRNADRRGSGRPSQPKFELPCREILRRFLHGQWPPKDETKAGEAPAAAADGDRPAPTPMSGPGADELKHRRVETPLDRLKPGFILAEPVCTKAGAEVFPAHTPLTGKAIMSFLDLAQSGAIGRDFYVVM